MQREKQKERVGVCVCVLDKLLKEIERIYSSKSNTVGDGWIGVWVGE